MHIMAVVESSNPDMVKELPFRFADQAHGA